MNNSEYYANKRMIVLLIPFIILIVIGLVIIKCGMDENKEAVDVKVTIVNMDEEYHRTRNGSGTTHITYVDYVYNGKEYKNVRYTDTYDKSWEIGDELTLKVHPDKPGVIHSDVLKVVMGVIFLASGVVMGTVVLIAAINAKRSLKNNVQQENGNVDTY